MFLLQAIPLTKIPHTQSQILSYFSVAFLPAGALVEIPLGRRKENGVVIECRPIENYKMEIKKAAYELKNINRAISLDSILTTQQIDLALFLGQYYFVSPGLFLKMALPRLRHPLRQGYGGQEGFGGQTKKLTRSVILRPEAEGSRTNVRQTLIIAPTVAQAENIAARYKNAALWHSGLKPKQLNEIWWQVKNGEARIIIGTRSTVFLPFANLKEIIIEDEQNPSHKSWDMFPRWRVHEAARKLAEIFSAGLTLKSDTPTIKNYYYKHSCHSDPAAAGEESRPNGRNEALHSQEILRRYAPQNDKIEIAVIDLRAEIKAGNFSIFSRALQETLKNALAQKKQVILFINRRGAANFVLCRDCGYVAKCQNCDAPLAYHLIYQKPRLLCHRCGHQEIPPSLCPQCQSHRIKTVGAGAQKVEMEAQKLFLEPSAPARKNTFFKKTSDAGAEGETPRRRPSLSEADFWPSGTGPKIARLDSDTAPQPNNQQKIIADFVDKKADVLIATPMIFSWMDELQKSSPAVIGLISADTLLHLPDFQSGERTWRIIMALKQLFYCHPEPRAKTARDKLREESSGNKATRATNSLDSSRLSPRLAEVLAKRTAAPQNDKQKTFIIQTYNPENSVIKYAAAGDWQNFYNEEMEARQLLNYPPFSQIVKLTFRHRDPKKTGQEAKILAAKLQRLNKNEKIEVSAALPAFIPRERGKFVWNIIIKFKLPPAVIPTPQMRGRNLSVCPSKTSMINSGFLQHRNSLLQYVPPNWEIDVDPENLL